MDELPVGTVVDRYQLLGLLGQGGMAMVYRVRHTQLGTHHALKVLTIPSAGIRQRLLQEGRVQAQLQHPNIVSVTDVIDVYGAPGLVMEYVSGPSLDQLLHKRRLTVSQCDQLVEGIVAGVQAAHSQQLIHRDLKPANVLIAVTDAGLIPKVTDFGLAKILAEGAEGQGTHSGAAMGTPSYMSPEQIRDAKRVDQRADIYSLGAMFYEMVTGTRAFPGDDMLEVFTRIRDGRSIPPRELVTDLPERIDEAIRGALQTDRDARIPDCQTLLATWRGGGGAVQTTFAAGPWDDAILADVGAPPATDPTFDEAAVSTADDNATVDFGAAPSSVAPTVPVQTTPPTTPAPRSSMGLVLGGAVGMGLFGAMVVMGIVVILGMGWAAGLFASSPEVVEAQAPAPTPPASPEPTPLPAASAPTRGAPDAPAADAPIAAPVPSLPVDRPAPSTPAPQPTIAPAPAVPHGTIEVKGDVPGVTLLPGAGGPALPPGRVPAGTYTVLAPFDGKKPIKAASVTIGPDQTQTVRCIRKARQCR